MVNKFIHVCLILLTVFLFMIMLSSLRWQIQHDSPIMLYIAWLIHDHDYVPYKDIFDFNLPGSYMAYILIGIVSGYTDTGCRLVDILILVAIFYLTWLWLKNLGTAVAWCGCVLWGLIYLGFGSAMSLQREYLIIPIILLVLNVAAHCRRLKPAIKYALIGFLWGICATIKPQSIIAFPLVMLYIWREIRAENTGAEGMPGKTTMISMILPAVAGFFVPVCLMVLYLWIRGALGAFWDMAIHYWPLYNNLTRNHETISGLSHVKYLIKEYRSLRGYGLWLAPAGLGTYIALFDSPLSGSQKRQVILLAGLSVCYSIYPVLTNKFWYYHWLFYLFFISQLSSVCLIKALPESKPGRRWFPVLFLFMSLFFIEGALSGPLVYLANPSRYLGELMGTKKSQPPKVARVEQIAAFLKENLEPGDKVQPLDWAGGALHAMLITRVEPATPFIYDFYFYHHISHPYIQNLRRKFILRLQESRPRFIIQIVDQGKPWVSGKDTTREFRELKAFMENSYTVVNKGSGYLIYELKQSSAR